MSRRKKSEKQGVRGFSPALSDGWSKQSLTWERFIEVVSFALQCKSDIG